MPSQAQNAYWSCDYCGLEGFRSFEEAKAHELEQCQRKRQRPGSSASAENSNPAGGQSSYSAGMGPLSAAVVAEMSGGGYDPSSTSRQQQPTAQQQQQRRFPLLMTGEEQHHPSLSMEDALACQNVGIFEATPDEVVADNSSAVAEGTGAIVVGQVGIRCIHCESSSPSVAYSTVFPSSVDTMGNSVQLVAERHLTQCHMTPPSVQDVIGQALQRRQQQQESSEEERNRTTALFEFCAGVCQRAGITNNRYPYKTGISFSDNIGAQQQQPGTEQRADTLATPAAAAPASVTDTRGAAAPGPPMAQSLPENTAGASAIAATPLMSRNKQQQDQDRQAQQQQQQRYPYDQQQQQGATPGGYSTFPPQYNPHGGGEGMYGQGQGAMGGAVDTPGTRSEGEQPPHHPGNPEASPHPHYQGYHMQQNPSPYEMQQPPPPQQSPPGGYPFFQDHNGSWCCRYCSSIHPQYRDPGAIWSTPSHGPPPGNFIDQHLSLCRAYNHAMQHPMPPQQHGWGAGGPPPPQQYPPAYPPPPHGYGGQPPQPGWGTPGGGGGGPPPPGMMISSTPMHSQQQHGHYSPTQPTPGPPGHPDHSYHYPPQPHHDVPHGGMMPPPSHPESHGGGGGGEHPGLLPTTPRAPTVASGSGGGSGPIPLRPDGTDSATRAALDHLIACDRENFAMEPRSVEGPLVLEEDKLLLTDYFFYLMKQLRVCRFSEADRKTRGGKRENIVVGYGGLQCIHCREAPNSRKFFWSNVDRLANSFAEIPGHILKCRRCPNQTKLALAELKTRHPEQMARLPRGSQKVFFRRMWRRLHDKDPKPEQPPEVKQASSDGAEQASGGGEVRTPAESDRSKTVTEAAGGVESTDSSPGTSTSTESPVLVQRSTEEAAKALAASTTTPTAPPSPSSRILLAIAEDKEWLSDMDCFIRRNLEVFCANEDDVTTAQSDRKYPVNLGQVGIRCIHCALAKDGDGARGTAVSFPYSISGIYESVREFQRLHLESCPNLPGSVKSKLSGFKGSSSLSSVLRKYYVLAAKALGMYDTPDGIRSGAESVPLGSSAAFAFSETSSSRVSEQMQAAESATAGSSSFLDTGPAITPLESRKRKNPPLSAEGASSDDTSKKRLQKEEEEEDV